jgi:hypothetical protein
MMSEIYNSVSGWLGLESTTSPQASQSEDYKEPMVYARQDSLTEPQQTYSGAWYGTETTRKTWNRISAEARSDTSMEISISYSEALRFLEGTD